MFNNMKMWKNSKKNTNLRINCLISSKNPNSNHKNTLFDVGMFILWIEFEKIKELEKKY